MKNIVAELDKEIARLKEARALLAGKSAGRAGKKGGGGKMSAAGRRRISEAMKKRWAQRRKAARAK